MDTEMLWYELNGSLRSFIARRVKRDADVEDLLQEAFLRFHTRRPQQAVNLAGWIYRVVRNLITDYHRGRFNESDAPYDDLPDYERFEVRESEQVAAGWLRNMAEELPEKYQVPVIMADFEGKTMKQVAAALGLSISGAKTRVQRGRKLMKAALLECCSFQFDHHGRVTTWKRHHKSDCCNASTGATDAD